MNKLILILILLLSRPVYAADYYTDHAVGWHWYDDPKEVENKKLPTTGSPLADPNEVVKTAKEKINTALNQVITNPTIENIENYLTLQEAMADRAEYISKLWGQAILQRPDLNYSLKYPTNSMALQVYHQSESNDKDKAISIFAKQSGLFFFYRSTCPYCQRFAPILKNFAQRFGIIIIPITMDGIPLPEFPDSKTDNGQSKQFNVSVTPSLFAVNPLTNKAFPVAYGLTSETELKDNIYKIMIQNRGVI